MDTSCEPMDVDMSANSTNLTCNNQEELISESTDPVSSSLKADINPEIWNIKKFHIKRAKTSRKECNNTVLCGVSSIIIIFSFIAYLALSIHCINDLDLISLTSKLHMRLYGQSEVIENLIDSLKQNVNSKIIFLYGGTGVGKTFTISLTLENFWNSSNVYHYTMPSFVNTFSTDTMIGINICDSSIVVVDDLKQGDFGIKSQIAEVIRKSENLNKQITVILIYNCDVISRDLTKSCDEAFYMELKHEFSEIDAYKTFIEYKPLTQDILKMCIKDELQGRHINDVEISNLLNNFNVTLDGCKGVYKKIKFLNIS